MFPPKHTAKVYSNLNTMNLTQTNLMFRINERGLNRNGKIIQLQTNQTKGLRPKRWTSHSIPYTGSDLFYFDLYSNTAYAAHYVYCTNKMTVLLFCMISLMATVSRFHHDVLSNHLIFSDIRSSQSISRKRYFYLLVRQTCKVLGKKL